MAWWGRIVRSYRLRTGAGRGRTVLVCRCPCGADYHVYADLVEGCTVQCWRCGAILFAADGE